MLEEDDTYPEYLRSQLVVAASTLFEEKTGKPISESTLFEWMLENAAVKIKELGANRLGEGNLVSARDHKMLNLTGAWVGSQIKNLKTNKSELTRQRKVIERVWHRSQISLHTLQEMDPGAFEYWVAGYFRQRGFKNVLVTQLSGDFGIDIYMTCPNRLPAVVQVKRYHGVVGRPVIQQTYGAMHLVKARRCYVVTSGRFAVTAKELEKEHKDIFLVDGMELITYL